MAFDTNKHNQAYFQMRASWTDALALYEPLPNTLAAYLFRYKSETDKEFGERLKRLAQVNFVEYVISHWVSMLFSTNPNVSCDDKYKDRVNAFYNDCNGGGDTLHEYMRDMGAPTSFLYGNVDFVVDAPEAKPIAGEITELDAEMQGLRNPYTYIIPPLNRMRWVTEDFNKQYKEYVSYDVVDTQVAAQMGKNDGKQYQEWTNDTVCKYDDAGNVQTQKPNPFGFIPIVPVLYRNSLRFHNDNLGVSLVKDVVPLQKLIINLISLIFDYHEQSNFTHRVIIQDTADGNADNAPSQEEGEAMSNHRVSMLFGANSDLKLLTPDPKGVESMQNLLQKLVDLLFLSCGLGSDYGQNKTHQSEATVRANNTGIFNKLNLMARNYEKSYKKILETGLRVSGATPAEVKEANITVTWDTNFSYEPFLNAVDELTAFKDVVNDISKSAVAELSKKVISVKLGTSGKWKEIEAEVDNWAQEKNIEPDETVGEKATTVPPAPETPDTPPVPPTQ